MNPRRSPIPRHARWAPLAAALLLGACASTGESPSRPETVFAITDSGALVRFNVGTPGRIEARFAVSGLAAGEQLLGIDFRPANGRLYAAGSSGRLYTLDPASGAASPVGTANHAGWMKGREIGFDFNPVVDRIRFVDDSGVNLRLHPDTGAVVDANTVATGTQIDIPLQYAMEDINEGKPARVVGAAYTNGAGTKGTTNYAIDAAQATLVTQGTRENQSPAKAPTTPNSGRLYTVGPLGVSPGERVGFDIEPRGNTAFASFTAGAGSAPQSTPQSTLYLINLQTGAASRLGAIGGEAVRAIAVVPLSPAPSRDASNPYGTK